MSDLGLRHWNMAELRFLLSGIPVLLVMECTTQLKQACVGATLLWHCPTVLAPEGQRRSNNNGAA